MKDKTFKRMLKDEIARLRDMVNGDLTSVIISREDFRLLAWEISKHENGFEDAIITIDNVDILASKSMPFQKGVRFEPIQH